MGSEVFWQSIEEGHSAIDPFFKMLLNECNCSSIACFNTLDEQDIVDLCQEMQRFVSNLNTECQSFIKLLECQPNFSKDFQLSIGVH